MDILTGFASGPSTRSLDPDVAQAVTAQAAQITQVAATFIDAACTQLRRWADEQGVDGPGRLAIIDAFSFDHDQGWAVQAAWVGDASGPQLLAQVDGPGLPGRLDQVRDLWSVLDDATRLLTGGGAAPFQVVDLDTATLLTVSNDREERDVAGEPADLFSVGAGPDEAPGMAELAERARSFGLPWPSGR